MTDHRSLVARAILLNWPLLALITIVACIGFSVQYSAAEGNFDPWASKQILRFCLLFPLMIVIAIIDIKVWYRLAYPIYAIVLVLLIFTEIHGTTAMGAQRWLRIGPLNIQPSELMKVSVVFACAHYFHAISPNNIGRILYLIPPLLMVVAPAVLVLIQPDLGTATILLAVGGTVFFAAGVRWWKFVVVGVGAICALPFLWMHMHDYQKKRVFSFLNPEEDPMGSGYNILQSKIAIGSGGFTGKGFLQGTQSQLSFLPEKQTDFIFTMYTEEFGFVGGVAVIALYALIILYSVYIAVQVRSTFGRLMAIGILAIFFFHSFINMAMVMGLIPVVGAPLPLLSYGGTIMMTILLGFGLMMNANVYAYESFSPHGK